MISEETPLALFALDQRVRKSLHMALCLPHLRVHQYRRIEPGHVVAHLHEHPPPELFDVVLQFDTERSVIPGPRESPVELRARIDETAPLRERDYFLHADFRHTE